jgi:fructokinase
MKPDNKLYGCIEAGGTKFVCAVASGPGDIKTLTRYPTSSPDETLGRAISFFKAQQSEYGPLSAIGAAAFGPVDPDPRSPYFGHITTTPKPGWAYTDVVGRLKDAFNLPIGFDTDVNGAALAEHSWGAARDVNTMVYLTVGTGIGGGAIINGNILHGLIHPEIGHMLLPHDREKDPYSGHCPFHGSCLEGLASGPAIEERWGMPAKELPSEHPAWKLQAYYLALGLHNLICIYSPQRIILGGGVMKRQQLLPMIHDQVKHSLNRYINSPAILDQIESYIVLPGLGAQAGVLGALYLAQQAHLQHNGSQVSLH